MRRVRSARSERALRGAPERPPVSVLRAGNGAVQMSERVAIEGEIGERTVCETAWSLDSGVADDDAVNTAIRDGVCDPLELAFVQVRGDLQDQFGSSHRWRRLQQLISSLIYPG